MAAQSGWCATTVCYAGLSRLQKREQVSYPTTGTLDEWSLAQDRGQGPLHFNATLRPEFLSGSKLHDTEHGHDF